MVLFNSKIQWLETEGKMGFRFRRSFRIAPGVRMNLGKGGFSSVSVGGLTFGKRGTYANFGIRGTGIAYRTRLDGGRVQRRPKTVRKTTSMPVHMELRNDGTIAFQDKNGNPLPEHLIQITKKQLRQGIVNWLNDECGSYNADIEKLINIHITTPAPRDEVVVNPKPEPPTLKRHGMVSRMLSSQKEKIDRENLERTTAYQKALSDWEVAEKDLRTNTETMGQVLEAALKSIVWPRETMISFDIVESGKRINLDVDFPEIEDMPENQAKVGVRDLKLIIDKRAKTQIQRDYLRHLHAIAFRLIGDVFAHLPSAETVVLSGYSQRNDKKTGNTKDEYLLSVKSSRSNWEIINFSNLAGIDPVACFEDHEVRREISKSGLLAEITPFGEG
ncbi:MAG: DUF4236 domain-containing protein [Anaerolineales bacterium]